MVQSGSKPLSGHQRMFFDHPAPPERISELFSKIESDGITWWRKFTHSYDNHFITNQMICATEVHVSPSMESPLWNFRSSWHRIPWWKSFTWMFSCKIALEVISSHFTEKIFLTFFRFFSSIFQSNFAYFWRIWAVQVAKNRFFSKISLVWKIRSLKS